LYKGTEINWTEWQCNCVARTAQRERTGS